MGNGLNFFTNAINKTLTAGSWQDVDVSGDGVPEGASGVILELRSLASGQYNHCALRKNGSSFDPYFSRIAYNNVGGYAFVGLDANRVFEAYIGTTDIEIWLIGYTGSDVVYFDSPADVAPNTTGSWQDIDLSDSPESIPSGATGVLCLIINATGSAYHYSGIRCNGSTDTFSYGIHNGGWGGLKWQYCGLDANRVMEMQLSVDTIQLYVYAYTKGEITFKTNGAEKSPSAANQWTDVDVTDETAASADGVLLMGKINSSYGSAQAHVRKNGSTDNRTTGKLFTYSEAVGTGQCAGMAIGLDSGQTYEAWVGSITELDIYVIGYNAPSEIGKAVTDSLALSDAIMRHKPNTVVSDGVGASDLVLGNKSPLIVADVVSLADLVDVLLGAILKIVLDGVGLSDVTLVNKPVAVAETVSVLDAVFRHKPSVSVSDVVSAAEVVLVSKLLATSDSVNLTDVLRVLKTLNVSDILSLLDAVSTPSRVLRALEVVNLADGASVHKSLIVTESISLVEVVEVGVGGKKTKLFLVLGDFAIQINGD